VSFPITLPEDNIFYQHHLSMSAGFHISLCGIAYVSLFVPIINSYARLPQCHTADQGLATCGAF